MKTSLRLMICGSMNGTTLGARGGTYILVLDVLEQLELAVGSFAEDWRAERFHDLLDSDRGTCELVLGRTGTNEENEGWGTRNAHHTRPNAPK